FTKTGFQSQFCQSGNKSLTDFVIGGGDTATKQGTMADKRVSQFAAMQNRPAAGRSFDQIEASLDNSFSVGIWQFLTIADRDGLGSPSVEAKSNAIALAGGDCPF